MRDVLHLAQDDSAHISVLVMYRHSKRHFEITRGLLDCIQQLNEGRAIVEGTNARRDAFFEVDASETRNWNENHVIATDCPAGHFEKGGELGDALVIPAYDVRRVYLRGLGYERS
jgi:hypothetical protein